MARNLSPALRRELANLDKDSDSRKSAMKALKSYVKDLDSKAIPLFLEQVSETKENGSLSGEYTISLYEVLARVHGINIVPQIDSIMETIVKTLASSAGSFPLQQACSKVVPAIARYGIDPTTSEIKKREIIHSLCKPLVESLLGCQESLTSGSALCLRALVESDNWRFAAEEMVNKVCLNVAAALEEKSTQTNSHMGLAMALAKHNAFTVEAYARLLIQSGLRILNSGAAESNSQKRLSAIQMVHFLMKCLDHRSVVSELKLIIKEMENCESDPMAFVSGAAFEAMVTARKIVAAEKKSNLEKHSNCSSCVSPESQTLGSFVGYDSPNGSPFSSTPISSSSGSDQRSVNRKLWRFPNGGVDVSLKDGIFSDVTRENGNCRSNSDSNCFIGFHHSSSNDSVSERSPTQTPKGSIYGVNLGDIRLFTTPRKLISSLQAAAAAADANSESAERKTNRFRSPCSSVCDWSPVRNHDQNGFIYDQSDDNSEEKGSPITNVLGESELGSSADELAVTESEEANLVDAAKEEKEVSAAGTIQKIRKRVSLKVICSLFLLFIAVMTSFVWLDNQREDVHLVPT